MRASKPFRFETRAPSQAALGEKAMLLTYCFARETIGQ
ncbi:hypothetical protein EPIB1_569 [Tritonibacter mobilis]|nr:hypothetical protein EPIB1_569 [Tritonibacter mobilis]